MGEMMNLIIACEVFRDELEKLKDLIKVDILWIDRSLHDFPDQLNIKIKGVIKEAEMLLEPGSTVLLFYGNCGGALDGIQSDTLQIIYPDVHDCIPILLGSIEKYRKLHSERPGVFYLNKAWIDSGAGPLNTVKKYTEIYGEAKGLRATKKLYKSYTHFMLIDNCGCQLKTHRDHVQEACKLFEKLYIEEKGNLDLMTAILKNASSMRKIPARSQKVSSQVGE